MKKMLFPVILISVLLISGCIQEGTGKSETEIQQDKISSLETSLSTCNQKAEDNEDFIEEYTISIINIQTAISNLELANGNLLFGNWYTSTEEYYYEDGESYFLTCKEQVNDAKELVNKAKSKLEKIKEKAPNEFFADDVEYRLEQISTLAAILNIYNNLCDYSNSQLYEINYGSEEKAEEYFNEYNEQIPVLNSNFESLSEVQNQIDLHWDQDWYAEYIGPSSK